MRYHNWWLIQYCIITLYAILYTIFLLQYQASTWYIIRSMMRMSEKLHKKHKLTQKDAFWKQQSCLYCIWYSIWTTVFLYHIVYYYIYTYRIRYHKRWRIRYRIITLYAMLYTKCLMQYQASTWCIFRSMMRMSEKLHKKHKLTQEDAFWNQQSCLYCIWYSIRTTALLYDIVYDIYTYRIRYHKRWRILYRIITLYAMLYHNTKCLMQYQAST
jgi:hypothetical protein